MSSLSEVRTSEFENALSPMVLKSFQITHLGLMLGVIAFTAVVFVVYSTGSVDDTGNDLLDLLNRLSLVHLFFAIAAYAMAAFIYKSRLRSDRVMGGGQGDVGGQGGSSLVEKCIPVIRTTLLIRIALMEGPAFFGLVICIIGARSGILRLHPEYWANLASGAALVGFVVMTFPNKERLVTIFEEKLKG